MSNSNAIFLKKTAVKKIASKNASVKKAPTKIAHTKKADVKKVSERVSVKKLEPEPRISKKKSTISLEKGVVLFSKKSDKPFPKDLVKKLPSKTTKSAMKKIIQNKSVVVQKVSASRVVEKSKKSLPKEKIPDKNVGRVAMLIPPGSKKIATSSVAPISSTSTKSVLIKSRQVHAKDNSIKTFNKSHPGGSLSFPSNPQSGVLQVTPLVLEVQGVDMKQHNDPGFLESNEVFDEADHAQHQQLREMAAIQQHAQGLNRPETHLDFDGEHCVSCGLDIPEIRLKMHKVRCVECQGELEEANARSSKMRMPPPRSGGLGWDDSGV